VKRRITLLSARSSPTIDRAANPARALARVEFSVSDVTTREAFHIAVEPGTAMDAFHHPYAYAARRESAYHHLARAEKTTVDG
jgi:hypothetical protein